MARGSYRSRISGPLLDRADIHIEAPALSINELRQENRVSPPRSYAPAYRPRATTSTPASLAAKSLPTPA